jgi:hypothetical protein
MVGRFILIVVFILLLSESGIGQWREIPQIGRSEVHFLTDSLGYGIPDPDYSRSLPLLRTVNAGVSWSNISDSVLRGQAIGYDYMDESPLGFRFISPAHAIIVGDSSYQTYHSSANYLSLWVDESLDSGRTWHSQSPFPNLSPASLGLVAITDSGKVVISIRQPTGSGVTAGNRLRLYYSSNFGASPYQQVMSDSDIWLHSIDSVASFEVNRSQVTMAVVQDTAGQTFVLRRLASDSTWQLVHTFDPMAIGGRTYAVRAGPNHIWIAGTSKGIYHSNDDGATWQQTPSLPTTVIDLSINARGQACAVCTNPRFAFFSGDTGRTWQREVLPLIPQFIPSHTEINAVGTRTLTGGYNDRRRDTYFLLAASNSKQHFGSIYIDSFAINLRLRPIDDSAIHTFQMKNDDTAAWTFVAGTSSDPRFHLLDSNVRIPPNGSATIHFKFAIRDLYETNVLTLRTNDPNADSIVLSVSARTNQAFLSFGQLPSLYQLEQGDTVMGLNFCYSSGTDTLLLFDVRSTSPFFTLSPVTQNTLAPGSNLTVKLLVYPTVPGFDSALIIFRSNTLRGYDTIVARSLVAAGHVHLAWNYTRRSSDDSAEYASSVGLTRFGEPVVAMEGTLKTTDQDILVSKLDTSGNLLWTSSIAGTAHSTDIPGNIVLDPNDNVYVTGSVLDDTTQLDWTAVSFDPNGNRRWAVVEGGKFDDRPVTSFLTSSSVVFLSKGYSSYVGDNLDYQSDLGEIGLLQSTFSSKDPTFQKLGGSSFVIEANGHYGGRVKQNDFPIGGASDAIGGFYMLNSIDLTDTVVYRSDQYAFRDKRINRLDHYGSDGALDWSLPVNGNLITATPAGNAIIYGTLVDSIYRYTSLGKLISADLYHGGRTSFIDGTSNDAYSLGLGLIRFKFGLDTLWSREYIGRAQYGQSYDQFSLIKLLTDWKDNVYSIGTTQGPFSKEVSVLKYDSSGRLVWIYTKKNRAPTSNTVHDAAIDRLGNIYVCGSTTDSLGHQRALLLKIEQDPIPGAVAQAEKPLTKILAYPNPFTREVVAAVPNSFGANYDYALIDVLGRKIASGTNLSSRTIKLNGESLAEGVYLLRISDVAGNVLEAKLVHHR